MSMKTVYGSGLSRGLRRKCNGGTHCCSREFGGCYLGEVSTGLIGKIVFVAKLLCIPTHILNNEMQSMNPDFDSHCTLYMFVLEGRFKKSELFSE